MKHSVICTTPKGKRVLVDSTSWTELSTAILILTLRTVNPSANIYTIESRL